MGRAAAGAGARRACTEGAHGGRTRRAHTEGAHGGRGGRFMEGLGVGSRRVWGRFHGGRVFVFDVGNLVVREEKRRCR